MTREDLIRFDSQLDLTKPSDEILSKKRGYYVYYNIPNKLTHTLMIHHHTCGHCKYGTGKIKNALKGRNGAWIGPCHSKEAMVIIIQDMFETTPEICSCCR